MNISANSFRLYTLAVASALLISGCSNSAQDSSNTDAWALGTKHDVVSQIDALHLTTVLSSAAGDHKLQVDLTCQSQGKISAEIISENLPLVWRPSFPALITPVKWRIGKLIRSDAAPRHDYNNVAVIDDFLSLSPATTWAGSLALEVTTEHGDVAVETSIDTPNARAFAEKCNVGSEAVKALKEEQKAKAEAIKAQHESGAKFAFSEALDRYWPKCGNQYVAKTVNGVSVVPDSMRQLSIESDSITPDDQGKGYEWRGLMAAHFDNPDLVRAGRSKVYGEAWKFYEGDGWHAEVYSRQECPIEKVSCPSPEALNVPDSPELEAAMNRIHTLLDARDSVQALTVALDARDRLSGSFRQEARLKKLIDQAERPQ